MAVEVGERAPDFKLPTDDWGEEASLGELTQSGPLVLFFYPGDWSSVCSDQLSVVQGEMERFTERGASVAAVSVDSPWSHKAFAQERGIEFPLLSDFGREVVESYGVKHERGFPERAYFVIDGGGTVRARRIESSPKDQPELDTVLADLDGAV